VGHQRETRRPAGFTNCSAESVVSPRIVYSHASGRDVKEVEDSVRSKMEQGYRHVRIQMGTYGRNIYRARRTSAMPVLACRRTA
jgi:hypothetical protein